MEPGRVSCRVCRKSLHPTAEQAEQSARVMETKAYYKRSVVFELRPYLCPVQPGWHIGHTLRT